MTSPPKHHLDRRAFRLIEDGVGNLDDLLSTEELARWLGVSIQWVEIGRHRGYGPKFKRIGRYRIRYLRNDVLAWLEGRTHASTAEYVKAELEENARATPDRRRIV
jgi:hypothetical protein